MNENRKETHCEMQLESQINKKSRKSYRTLCVTLVAVLIIAIICMTGCKRRTNDDEPTTSSEPTVTEKTETSEEPEVSEETAVTEETEALEQPDNLSGNDSSIQSVDSWIETVDSNSRVTVWNEITGEGVVLEEGQVYTVVEGDNLVVRHDLFAITSSVSIDKENINGVYFLADMNQFLEIDSSITITVAAEPRYSITFELDMSVIGNESGEEIASEGESWVASLDYDEPKLVIFNDDTGVNTVVEDGETYQMQPGDQMAVYIPEGYEYAGVTYGRGDGYNNIFKDNYVLIEYEYNESTTHYMLMYDFNYNPISYTYEILPAN